MKNILTLTLIVFATSLQAQIKLIGQVVDSTGHSVHNASIEVLGTTIKAVSDINGGFSLSLSKNQGRLLIKHLQYDNKELSFDNTDRPILVVLKQHMRKIDEVQVSTGYQTLSKERSTGSFEFVDQKTLEARSTYGIIEKLEGLVPGLQFDNRTGKSILNIRGIATLNSLQIQPLIVLDNFPYQGDLSNINPNDIESVTILKDAAASSIWGARAGNGVIVLTSKKAQESEKWALSYSGNINTAARPNLYGRNRISTNDFIDVELFLFNNKFYDATYNNTRRNRYVFSPVVDMLYKNKNNTLSDENLERAIAELRGVNYLDELSKEIYRPSLRQQHHISLTSGTPKLSNLIAIGYDYNKGQRIGSNDSRFTAKISNRYKINEKIETTVGFNYSNQSDDAYLEVINETYQTGGGKGFIYPYARLRDEYGNALAVPRGYNLEYIESLASTPLLDWRYVPLDDLGLSYSNGRQNYVQGQVGIELKPLKGFNMSGTYNFERQLLNSTAINGEESYYVRDMVNKFSQVNGNQIIYILPQGAIRYSESAEMQSHNLRGQANYSNMWKEHQITLLVGSELSHRETFANGFRSYGYDVKRKTSIPVDYVNSYPIYGGLGSYSRIPSGDLFNSSIQRFVSFYGNIGYNYKSRYGLSFSTRKDASNIFGVKTNDRWNPLWSAGASWTLSEEPWLTNEKWIDRLVLRATYGHSGNSGGGANPLPTIYYVPPSSNNISLLQQADVARLSNPNLKWEDVATKNLGLDFSLFDRAVSGQVQFYHKRSTDLISEDFVDITTGLSTIIKNVASIDGKGFEISLATTYSFGGFSGKTTLHGTKSRSVVKVFNGNIGLGSTYANGNSTALTPLPDKELYPVFSYRFAGLNPDNGNPRGIYNGEVSEDYAKLLYDSLQNLNYHGTALPPYYGSLIQELNWGDINLRFLITYKFGHYFKKSTINYNALFTSWSGHTDFEQRWKQPGDELFTDIPSMIYPAIANRDNFFGSSDANILEGGVIRIKDIRLSYRLQFKYGKNTLRGQVFASTNGGKPLWVQNKYGIDPEYINRPPQKVYSLGISLNF
ncbi:SusC/RagA family TonB-linked outer membrane protein [Sphingobacterium faecale]|uniref:SusC/RagA family TonB-linked outer membrane protein n=1 Tax=Sphingobacterium faecale TaxID=2803775 RepID=A0ABS1QYY6_9SPHI|nr:SusC/RagA family TonB-linked outer membrane protein [Sphingobacterium faecale]MBL1407643.1 SusC/RagA family TonB-linked outer membrane protein [Sphingobacterium faecale]